MEKKAAAEIPDMRDRATVQFEPDTADGIETDLRDQSLRYADSDREENLPRSLCQCRYRNEEQEQEEEATHESGCIISGSCV